VWSRQLSPIRETARHAKSLHQPCAGRRFEDRRDVRLLRHPVCRRGNDGDLREHTAGIVPGNNPVYELGFRMRSFIAILFMLVALWQVTGGMQIDLATATLAIAAAWFLSLFVGD
jgi:hypothetical protein